MGRSTSSSSSQKPTMGNNLIFEQLVHTINQRQDASQLITTGLNSEAALQGFVATMLSKLEALNCEETAAPTHLLKLNPACPSDHTYFQMLKTVFKHKTAQPHLQSLFTAGDLNALLEHTKLYAYQRYYLLRQLKPKQKTQLLTLHQAAGQEVIKFQQQLTQQKNNAVIRTMRTNNEHSDKDNQQALDPRNFFSRWWAGQDIKRAKRLQNQAEQPAFDTAQHCLFLLEHRTFKPLLMCLNPCTLDQKDMYQTAVTTVGRTHALQKRFRQGFKHLSTQQQGTIIQQWISHIYGDPPFQANKKVPVSLFKAIEFFIGREKIKKYELVEFLKYSGQHAARAFKAPRPALIKLGTFVLGFFTVSSATPWIFTWAYTTYYSLPLTFAAVPPLMLLGVMSAVGSIAGLGLCAVRFYHRKNSVSVKKRKKESAQERTMVMGYSQSSAAEQTNKIFLRGLSELSPWQREKSKQDALRKNSGDLDEAELSTLSYSDSPTSLWGNVSLQEQLNECLLNDSLKSYHLHASTDLRKQLNQFLDKKLLHHLPKTCLSRSKTINRFFAFIHLENTIIQFNCNSHKVYNSWGRRFLKACVFLMGSAAGWGGLHFTALLIAVITQNPFTVFGLEPAIFAVSLAMPALFCGYIMQAYFFELLKFRTHRLSDPCNQNINPYANSLKHLEPSIHGLKNNESRDMLAHYSQGLGLQEAKKATPSLPKTKTIDYSYLSELNEVKKGVWE